MGSRTPSKGTRERLVDVAEKLFAQKGLEGASVRELTSRSRANLAAIHYHFGSKKNLIHSVIERRVIPLNQVRLHLLDHAEALARGRAVPLSAILHSFIDPMMKLLDDAPYFVRLAGRIHSDPNKSLQIYFLSLFDEVIRRYVAALRKTLPRLPVPELLWRMHFILGAIIYTWTNHLYLEEISQGACRITDEPEVVERLVRLGVATLKAPALKRKRRK